MSFDPYAVAVRVIDREVAGHLDYNRTAEYLRARGFSPDPGQGLAVWSNAGGVFLVICPAGYADYAQRNLELIADLAIHEGRSELAVLRDLIGGAP